MSGGISTSLAPSSPIESSTLKSGFTFKPVPATKRSASAVERTALSLTRKEATRSLEVDARARRPRVGRMTYCCGRAADFRMRFLSERFGWGQSGGERLTVGGLQAVLQRPCAQATASRARAFATSAANPAAKAPAHPATARETRRTGKCHAR